MNDSGINGKTILVTGASSGVGREVAIQLSRAGAKIVVMARREEKLKETLALMDGTGHSFVALDMSNFDDVIDAIKEIVASSGKKIDSVAHCVGAVAPAPLRSLTKESLDFAFQTNLYSFAAILKCAASKRFFNENGAIVGVSGVVSLYGQAGNGAYAASKGALNALVKSAAIELIPRNIRVNAVCPGGILTDMVKDLPTNGLQQPDGKTVIGNILLPEHVASVIVSFLGNGMDHVSGTILEIDDKFGVKSKQ